MASDGEDTVAFEVLRVAHAGGALGNRTYTNSYQALDANLKRGFRYFEVDFVFTRDGHIVCLHDWKDNFRKSFGFTVDGPLTFAEFQRLAQENPRFTNCTLDGLADWMRKNREAVIITDIRGDTLAGLDLIGDRLPDATRRVIPQIYDPADYADVKALGFEQIIWTLYRYRGADYSVIQWAQTFDGSFAIALPARKARTPLPRALAQRGIPTYAHTINRAEAANALFRKHGISEIYTDHLAPSESGSIRP